jgi:sulfur carrier protein ThiS
MKIRVILFGTLRKSFADHDPVHGMEVEIPEGSTVGDLIAHIDLPAKKFGLVSVDGQLVKAGNLLQENAVVRVFQPIFGG